MRDKKKKNRNNLLVRKITRGDVIIDEKNIGAHSIRSRSRRESVIIQLLPVFLKNNNAKSWRPVEKERESVCVARPRKQVRPTDRDIIIDDIYEFHAQRFAGRRGESLPSWCRRCRNTK